MTAGTLTYIIGDVKKLDLLRCALYTSSRRSSRPVEIVLARELPSRSTPTAMGLIFEDLDFPDGSKIGAVEDYFREEMIYIAIACSAEAIDRLRNRVPNDRARTCRYVVAVAVEQAPGMLHAAANLAFFHQPVYDHRSLIASAEYALSLAERRKVDALTDPLNRQTRTGRPVDVLNQGVKANDHLTLNFVMPLTRYGFRFDHLHVNELEDHLLISGEAKGVAVYGPYLELGPGSYHVSWTVSADQALVRERNARLTLDVFHGDRKLGKRDVEVTVEDQGENRYGIDFAISPQSAMHPVEFRIWQRGNVPIRISNIVVRSTR